MSSLDSLIVILLIAAFIFLFYKSMSGDYSRWKEQNQPKAEGKKRMSHTWDEERIKEVHEQARAKILESRAKHYRTGALDDGHIREVIEINHTHRANYPVSYTPPEKPSPVKPKVTKIAETAKADSALPKSYEPNAILAPVIAETRGEYQLPPGAVEMPPEETAVIAAVILYFIQEEPKIGITKLESYIIMLDKLCFDEKGRRLFSYRLTEGPFGYYIQNFRAFLDFLEEKELLTKRKEYYTRRKYRMDFTAHKEVTAELFPMEMRDWMGGYCVHGVEREHTQRSAM